MKSILRNRANKPPSTPASTPAAEPEKPAPKFTPRGGSGKNRILIAVKDERIDFASMSPESAKTFNELMHKPDVQAQFGIGPLKEGFDPQHCKRIYEALGLIIMGGCKAAFKWPNEALVKLAYTEAEKEELAKPTASVLDELAPMWLRENQAVAALLLVFGAMTQNKFREAATVAAEIKKQQAQAGGGAAQPAKPSRSPIPIDHQPVAEVQTAASGIHVEVTGAGPRQYN